jgi:hypothetical protein
MTYDTALAHFFGDDVDQLCANYALNLDAATRGQLLREIGKAAHLAVDRIERSADGDYSPDPHASRFPAFEPLPPQRPGPRGLKAITAEKLYADWKAHNSDKKAESTLRRYAPSIESLCKF